MTVARSQDGAPRDVEAELAQQRAEKRRQRGGVSPLAFHKELLVGDDWNCLFLLHLCRGVTLHHFQVPPETVLDLGCGSGLWCIEAAKVWQDTNFIGFDLRDVQPDLTQVQLGIQCRDLSKRIKWLHGDFLNPLPFESDHFDFVRICSIGLEVPEDSWQELLEECARVLKPGAALEIYEEDLLFPAGRTRLLDAERTSGLPTAPLRRPSGERLRSDSAASKLTTTTAHSVQTTHSARTTHSSTPSNPSITYTTERTTNSISIDSYFSTSSNADTHFTQDHVRLKHAWEEMLSQRFLSHRLLAVLPFYLSTFFTNVSVHPTMHVLLPPPSAQRQRAHRDIVDNEALAQWLKDMWDGMVRLNGEGDRKASASALRARPPAATVTTWGTLHLARQVRRISACKKAIWEMYRDLEGPQEVRGAAKGEQPRDDLRDEFERDWSAWEIDMKDRMGARGQVQVALSWIDPDTTSNRAASFISSQAQSKRGSDQDDLEPDKAPVCRAMRGFAAWKA